MAYMSIVCTSAGITTAAGCRIYLDRPGASQQHSMAVLPASSAGYGSHEIRLPSPRKSLKRAALRTKPAYLLQFSPSMKTTICTMQSDPKVLEAWSMEESYDALANRLLEISRKMTPRDKYMVGLAGPPGSGKSTIAGEVTTRLNKLWREDRWWSNETADISIAVPMDGFHLYRSQLDAFEDPTEAHARRGAPWTFDPVRLVDSLHTLRSKGSVSLPSFDHGVGDPVEDDIYVEDGHKVVVVEGNYLLLNDGAWSDLLPIFDERWYIEVDIDEAMSRLEKRHVLTGKPPEIAKYHVSYNDRPNAELICESKWNADLWIQSIPLRVSDPGL